MNLDTRLSHPQYTDAMMNRQAKLIPQAVLIASVLVTMLLNVWSRLPVTCSICKTAFHSVPFF